MGVAGDMTAAQFAALASLLTAWYSAHRAGGGAVDQVAEDLLSEVRAEDMAGQRYSHAPGRA